MDLYGAILASCVEDGLVPGWEQLDRNDATIAIAAAGKELLQLHTDGSVWIYNGSPCVGFSLHRLGTTG
jgi:hypothetical protein